MMKGESDRLLQHFPTKQSSTRLLQPIRSGPTRRGSLLQPVRSEPARPRRESVRRLQPYHVSTDLSTAEGDGPETERKWVHKIEYLYEMIVGVDLFMVFTAASVITFFANHIIGNNWMSFISDSKPAIATLGAFYSFALVFRTHICYARWWEGRILWGTIIVTSIRITQQAHLWIENPVLIQRLSRLAMIFCYCCKSQLRGAGIQDESEGGAQLFQKRIISQEELDIMSAQGGWQPFYCIDAMRASIAAGLKSNENQDGWERNAAQAAMEAAIVTLSTSIGGCIRVRSTGLPVAYDDILNMTGVIFFTVACLAWSSGMGPYNPFVVAIVYTIVKMIVCVGSDMEDPFGQDESDLPLERFCEEVEKQINAIDERAKIITFDFAYGPSSHLSDQNDSSCSTFPMTASYQGSNTSTDEDIESGLISVNGFTTPHNILPAAAARPSSILYAEKSNVGEDDFISDFCIGTNTFWKGLVVKPVRDLVEVRPATITPDSPIIDKLTSPPELPGISRPVWLTILGSVPTGLVWYGYYKFSVEEELFQYELQQTGKVSGCGGYGTLFPFVYGILIGFPASFLHIPGGEFLVEAAGAWILLGQVNLYNRVNELCTESEDMKSELGLTEGPLVEWWAILPPPLDVVVGLRQVHFLSEYWRVKRGDSKQNDVIAETLFPFISLPEKFTLKQFFRRPKYWFWFTKEWEDFEFEFLKD